MTTSRLLSRVAATLLVAVTLGLGCGSDDAGRFDASVAAVRSAVEIGDQTAALQALDDLHAKAVEAHGAGDLSDEELAEVAALVESSRALVARLTPAPEPPSTTTTTSTSTPPTTEKAKSEKGKKKHEKDDKKDD